MKNGCPDIIQMTKQVEKAAFLFIVPNFDFVVIATRDK